MLASISASRQEMLYPVPAHSGSGWLSRIRHAAWLGLWASERQFARAARDPQAAQWNLLQRMLAANANTQYGRAHGFDKISSLKMYQANVPVVDYEALKPWIAQITARKSGVLTAEAVHALRRSAGASGAPKVIPQTDGLLDQVGAAMRPWLHSWLAAAPSLLRRTFYWEMAPARRDALHSQAGVPYSSEDPANFLGGIAGWSLHAHLAVSPQVQHMAHVSRWRRTLLHSLLASERLGAMFLSNPAHMLELMQNLSDDLPEQLERLPKARAQQIRDGLDTHGRLCGPALWPHLRAIACWRDGPSAALLTELQRYFPNVSWRSAPIATKEGILTVPLWNVRHGAPLAVTSHFFEFVDVQEPRKLPLLAHALKEGGTYLPIITTAGGLYRYQTHDAVACVGFHQNLPLLRYVDKAAPVGNLHGEQLAPHEVRQAIDETTKKLKMSHTFAMLAPLPSPAQRYCLYIDTGASDATLGQLASTLEEALCRGYPYWYGRHNHHLEPVQVRRVKNGWQRYQRAMQDFSVPAWEVKATALDTRSIWPMVFIDA